MDFLDREIYGFECFLGLPFCSLRGWQSLLKKSSKQKKAKKTKMDSDVTMLQTLFSPNGQLPSQYSAWTPA